MSKLTTLSRLFYDDKKKQGYYITKLFPFSLKNEVKSWFNNLVSGSIKSFDELGKIFFEKYYHAHVQHAALQRIFNFKQIEKECLPKAWGEVLCLTQGAAWAQDT